MATDHELYLAYAAGEHPRDIAARLNLSYASVRGRISREARRMTNTTITRLKELSRPPLDADPDILAQQAILTASLATYKAHLKAHKAGRVLWLSDIHFPYTRFDALALAYDIAASLDPPATWITTLNDLSDFGQYGRWGIEATPASALWSSNIQYGIDLIAAHHKALKEAAPTAELLGLAGNHDQWLFQYLRNSGSATGFVEKSITYYMSALHEQGVLFFSRETKVEPVITLGALKLVHGVSAAALDSTVGKKAIDAMREGRQAFYTASGHVHRSFVVSYGGVKHWNFGCLCRFDLPYLKHRPHWRLGVGVLDYGPDGVEGHIIDFVAGGRWLEASWQGKSWRVPLEKGV